MNKSLNKKVFVGLSGGVDSATSAALLKEAGFDVTGVFIKVWQPDWIECTWKEDRRDAMRVAAHLNIPFVTLDLEREYKKEVIDYMIAEYKAGRTPNPDVMCNQHVKFGAFYDWAISEGSDFVATGHYCRVGHRVGKSASGYASRSADRALLLADVSAPKAPAANFPTLCPSLLAANDTNKDQSYFLWTIKKEQLPHILFPVGNIEKPEVRKLAKKFKLPNAEKKDSQGLCFIGKVDIKEFLSHYMKTKRGNVLNINGKVIGTHPGALFFTIGERHGFTITDKTPADSAFYVISKDVEANTITVSNKKGDSLESGSKKGVTISNVNWIGEVPKAGSKLSARSRYREPLQDIKIISIDNSKAVIKFEVAQDTLTPGQSLVIYNGEICVGGGIIE